MSKAVIDILAEKYSLHPSVIKIKNNFKNLNLFSYKLLKNIDANNVIACDLIPTKLIKIAAGQFAEPLTYIINSTITQSFFPNKAKQASVTPVDKGENDKDTFSNYRPVSVLNTFFKIIELSIFEQITICPNEFLSVFVGAYRKHYGT